MDDCVFCRILRADTEASIVYEDEISAAFMDIQPVNPGHLLVVPREHFTDFAHTPAPLAAHLMTVAQRLALAVRVAAPRCEGVNLLVADGEAAGQEVFHLHLHVIPRFAGDGFGFRFNRAYYKLPTRDDLDEVAGGVRAALGT
ncbi:MAG: HIT family protein [bacterium]